jgi:hypothetical protein
MKAIINSGNRRLLGEIFKEKDEASPGDNVLVKNAYELRCDMFLLPTPQGPVGMHKSTVTYLDVEESPIDILVKIDNIRWFDDMPDKGQKYELLIAKFEEMMLQTRANQAGIQVAKQIPSQQTNKFIF